MTDQFSHVPVCFLPYGRGFAVRVSLCAGAGAGVGVDVCEPELDDDEPDDVEPEDAVGTYVGVFEFPLCV